MSKIGDIYNSIMGLCSRKERSAYDELLGGLGISNELSKELAYMVVLVSMATIDNQFDPKEFSFIFTEMEKRFNLSRDQIERTIKQVELMIATAGGTQFIFEHIRKNFSEADRSQLLEMVQGLVRADNLIDGFESYLTETYRKQLGLCS